MHRLSRLFARSVVARRREEPACEQHHAAHKREDDADCQVLSTLQSPTRTAAATATPRSPSSVPLVSSSRSAASLVNSPVGSKPPATTDSMTPPPVGARTSSYPTQPSSRALTAARVWRGWTPPFSATHVKPRLQTGPTSMRRRSSTVVMPSNETASTASKTPRRSGCGRPAGEAELTCRGPGRRRGRS